MGGEWHSKELINLLRIAKTFKLKTCLYTGEENISQEILGELTFVKTGKYIPELGGLNKITTNQIFMNVETKEILNHLFRD